MAGPRDIIRFDGIDANQVTYLADGVDIVFNASQPGGSAAVGRAVSISAHKTVRLAGAGERVLGKLVLVEPDGKVAVQEEGYASLPAGDSVTITPGSRIVGALGPAGARGYIQSVNPATLAQVAAGDGEVVDGSDLSQVWVKL